MKTNGNGCSWAVNGEAPGMTAKFRERFDGLGADAPENGDAESARKIEQSLDYMRQHLDQPLQVADLAARVNVSPSHFFALFKRRTGSAPIDYFIRLRMQHACRLLDETSLNVKEVAATLGYDDPFYFSRVFKAVNHVPPSRYRVSRPIGRDPMEHPTRQPLLSKEALIPA